MFLQGVNSLLVFVEVVTYLMFQSSIYIMTKLVEKGIENVSSKAYRQELRKSDLVSYIDSARKGEEINQSDAHRIQHEINNAIEKYIEQGARGISISSLVVTALLWIISYWLAGDYLDSRVSQVFGLEVGDFQRVLLYGPFMALLILDSILILENRVHRTHTKWRKWIIAGFTAIFDLAVIIIVRAVSEIQFFQALSEMVLLVLTIVGTIILGIGYNTRIIMKGILDNDRENAEEYGRCVFSIQKISAVECIARKRFLDFGSTNKIDTSSMTTHKTPLQNIVDQGILLFEGNFDDISDEYKTTTQKILLMSIDQLEFRFYDEYCDLLALSDLDSNAIRILLSFDNNSYRQYVAPKLVPMKSQEVSFRESYKQAISKIASEVIVDEYGVLRDFLLEIGINYLEKSIKRRDEKYLELKEKLTQFIKIAKSILEFINYAITLNKEKNDLNIQALSGNELGSVFRSDIPTNLTEKHLGEIYEHMSASTRKIPFEAIYSCYTYEIRNNKEEAYIWIANFTSKKKTNPKWIALFLSHITAGLTDNQIIYNFTAEVLTKKELVMKDDVAWTIMILNKTLNYCSKIKSMPIAINENRNTDENLLVWLLDALDKKDERKAIIVLISKYTYNELKTDQGIGIAIAIRLMVDDGFISESTDKLLFYYEFPEAVRLDCYRYLISIDLCMRYSIPFDELWKSLIIFVQILSRTAEQWHRTKSIANPIAACKIAVDFVFECFHTQYEKLNAVKNHQEIQSERNDPLLEIVGFRAFSDFVTYQSSNLDNEDIAPLLEVLCSENMTMNYTSLAIAIATNAGLEIVTNAARSLIGDFKGERALLRICYLWLNVQKRRSQVELALEMLYNDVISSIYRWSSNLDELRDSVLEELKKSYSENLFKFPKILAIERNMDFIVDLLRIISENIAQFIDRIDDYKLEIQYDDTQLDFIADVQDIFSSLSKSILPNKVVTTYHLLEKALSHICEGGSNEAYVIFLIAVIANSSSTLQPEGFEEYVRKHLSKNSEALNYAIVYCDNYTATDNMMIIRYFRLVELVGKWERMDADNSVKEKIINQMQKTLEQSGWVKAFRELRETEKLILEDEVRTTRKVSRIASLKELIENPSERSARLARSIQGIFYSWSIKDKELDRILSERPYNLFVLNWHTNTIKYEGLRPDKSLSKLKKGTYTSTKAIIDEWIEENDTRLGLGSPFLIGQAARIGKIPDGYVFEQFKQIVYNEIAQECVIHFGEYPRLLLVRFAPSPYSVQAISDADSIGMGVIESILHTHKDIGKGSRQTQIEKFERRSIIGQLTLIETFTTFETLAALESGMDKYSITILELIEKNPFRLYSGMLIKEEYIKFYDKVENKRKFEKILETIKRNLGLSNLWHVSKHSRLKYQIQEAVRTQYLSRNRQIKMNERRMAIDLLTWLFEVITDLEAFLNV